MAHIREDARNLKEPFVTVGARGGDNRSVDLILPTDRHGVGFDGITIAFTSIAQIDRLRAACDIARERWIEEHAHTARPTPAIKLEQGDQVVLGDDVPVVKRVAIQRDGVYVSWHDEPQATRFGPNDLLQVLSRTRDDGRHGTSERRAPEPDIQAGTAGASPDDIDKQIGFVDAMLAARRERSSR